MYRGVIDLASRYYQPEHERDFTALSLRPDHHDRLLWIDGWGKLTFESFHPLAPRVQDFLTTVAEPTSRPTFLHEYRITTQSLYAAVSVGLTSKDIMRTLNRFLKIQMPTNVIKLITYCGNSYGKVKIVLKNQKNLVETADSEILQMLLKDPEIGPCRVQGDEEITVSAPTMAGFTIAGKKDAAGVREAEGGDQSRWHQDQSDQSPTAEEVSAALNEDDNDDLADIIYEFQIKHVKVSTVAQRCLALHYPALEEYDFKNDHVNANLPMDLRPATWIRPYQEHCLSNIFGNGRAKSGLIVLPCGAGKILVCVIAACTIKKGVVVLASGRMSSRNGQT